MSRKPITRRDVVSFDQIISAAGSLDAEALIRLRAEIDRLIDCRAAHLRGEIAAIGRATPGKPWRISSSLHGRKVPAKFRDPSGKAWSGRGSHPRWLRELLAAGRAIDEFRIQ